MSKEEQAIISFAGGYNCSQTVLSLYASRFDMDRETALRIGSVFGGGMGRLALTCGAITGAFMVIGLARGWVDPNDKERREKGYALAGELAGRFNERNGALDCRELLGCDIGTKEGFKQAREQKLFTSRCPAFIRSAVEILEEIL